MTGVSHITRVPPRERRAVAAEPRLQDFEDARRLGLLLAHFLRVHEGLDELQEAKGLLEPDREEVDVHDAPRAHDERVDAWVGKVGVPCHFNV